MNVVLVHGAFQADLVNVKLSGVGICDVQRCITSKLAAIIAFAVTYWVVKMEQFIFSSKNDEKMMLTLVQDAAPLFVPVFKWKYGFKKGLHQQSGRVY